ncbi:YoaK family protein [Variovorax saccharolyticus]|uniref:YoaK family protein n=1 Tax=Variovorax saccharolyticus TaxID=3053516 RepID=UPI002574B02B|nr:YoaK family protein [Variovorax sp. J31P216]MDM0026065.1 YoaK family protein [Variovorax sp. J31P216]
MNVDTERPDPTRALPIAVLMSFLGGFLDAYSYVGWGGVFAGAQSGNIILMAIAMAQGHWFAATRHLPSILAFGLGVVAAETLRMPRPASLLRRPDIAALALEATALLVIGLLSPAVPAALVTAVLAFAAGLQLSYFGRVHGWTYNSTMTTGNLRNLIEAMTGMAFRRDHAAQTQAIALSMVIAAFAAGAGIGGLATCRFQAHAIWMAIPVLSLGIRMLSTSSRSIAPPVPRRADDPQGIASATLASPGRNSAETRA